jgi:hypothetical protein
VEGKECEEEIVTDPDQAPRPVEEAATAAALQIRRVWQLAFAQGVREGMEAAAQICESVSVTTRAKPGGVIGPDIPTIATADFLRDRIREFALMIEDPPPEEAMP